MPFHCSLRDNSDVRLIAMYRKLPRQSNCNIIRLIRISHSYCFIWSLAIRIRRIQLYLAEYIEDKQKLAQKHKVSHQFLSAHSFTGTRSV